MLFKWTIPFSHLEIIHWLSTAYRLSTVSIAKQRDNACGSIRLSVRLRIVHIHDAMLDIALLKLKNNVFTLRFAQIVVHMCKVKIISLTFHSTLVQFNRGCLIEMSFLGEKCVFSKFHFQLWAQKPCQPNNPCNLKFNGWKKKTTRRFWINGLDTKLSPIKVFRGHLKISVHCNFILQNFWDGITFFWGGVREIWTSFFLIAS